MNTPYQSRHEPLIETTLRVVDWNLWGLHYHWEERLQRIEQTLASLDADVITLQEVWGKDGISSASRLADALGYEFYFDADGRNLDAETGNAILSRWPITSTSTLKLSGGGQSIEGLVVVRADIEGPRGAIPVFSAHLNWRFHHSSIRQAQVAELAHFVAESRPRGYPAIVCGDFNADPASDEVRMMTGRVAVPVHNLVFLDAWEVGGDGSVGYTWDTTNPVVETKLEPNRRIDYIFVGWPKDNGGAGHVKSCRIIGNKPIDGMYPSDHFGLVADLRY